MRTKVFTSALTSFSAGGHTVYQLKPGTIGKKEKREIISAAYDGYVTCHSWKGNFSGKYNQGKVFLSISRFQILIPMVLKNHWYSPQAEIFMPLITTVNSILENKELN